MWAMTNTTQGFASFILPQSFDTKPMQDGADGVVTPGLRNNLRLAHNDCNVNPTVEGAILLSFSGLRAFLLSMRTNMRVTVSAGATFDPPNGKAGARSCKTCSPSRISTSDKTDRASMKKKAADPDLSKMEDRTRRGSLDQMQEAKSKDRAEGYRPRGNDATISSALSGPTTSLATRSGAPST